MSSTARKAEQQFTAAQSAPDTAAFLQEMTELSRRHSLGLTGSITLFVMEPDDFERTYTSDNESRVQFA